MTRLLRTLAFAALVAAGTTVAGWWTVPVLAAIWARALPRPRAVVRTCALGAALGWAALLAWTASEGPLSPIAQRTSGVLQLPPWGLIGLTLLFPALLAGAAARAVRHGPAR
jgi:hypothetical protein